MVGRVGPAFSLDEIPASHDVLDRVGVPRRLQGVELTLPERISYLAGMLASARAAQVKQIFVIHKDDIGGVIPSVSLESEVES